MNIKQAKQRWNESLYDDKFISLMNKVMSKIPNGWETAIAQAQNIEDVIRYYEQGDALYLQIVSDFFRDYPLQYKSSERKVAVGVAKVVIALLKDEYQSPWNSQQLLKQVRILQFVKK